MKTWVLGGAGVVALVLAAACGGDDDGGGTQPVAGSGPGVGSGGEAGGGQGEGGEPPGGVAGSGGGSGGSGGSAGTGGGQALAGAAGDGGGGSSGGSPVVTFQSRPSGIELELDAASKEAGFALSTSSIKQESTASLNYTEWLAELVNGTGETQCLIAVTGDFQDAQGSTVQKYATYAYGPAYDLGVLTTTSSCAAPGARVPIWGNDLPEDAIDVSRIKKLVVTLEPIASPAAVVHPMTPALSTPTKTYSPSFEQWAIAATATSTADIYNVSVTFWGKDGAFFVDSEKAFHLEDFPEGDTWAIDTAPLGLETVSLTEVIPYFSFIEGASASPRLSLDPQSLRTLERRSHAVSVWDAAEARRARFRALRP